MTTTPEFNWLAKVAELKELLRQQRRFRDSTPTWEALGFKIDLVVSEMESEVAAKQ